MEGVPKLIDLGPDLPAKGLDAIFKRFGATFDGLLDQSCKINRHVMAPMVNATVSDVANA